MTVLDASVVIAQLNPADPYHDRAAALLLSENTFAIHAVTLAEVLVGAARVGRTHELYADLAAMGISLASSDETEPVRVAELRARTQLKLPDCYPLALAIDRGQRLATFDAALRKAAVRAGTPVA